jgi:chromosome segregation protein
MGPRSYSIIEQGMISRLIEAKPDDLRAFLEEAAGISKYKERRRETENRIRHTRENLDRLNDLLEEIDKQLDKLKRQSRAAERYKELKEEERQVKAELLALRYHEMHEESAGRERQLQERQLAMEAELAAQRSIEAELEKLRASLGEANETFNSVQGHYYKLGADVARVEQAIQHNKESRQQQQQELARAEQTLGEVEEHIRVDSDRLEELAREIQVIDPELTACRERTGESAAALKEAEQAMQAWQADWDAFNRRQAEHSQSAQVERTRLDHLDRHLQHLDDRLQRMDEEHQTLGSQPVEAEIEQLAQQSEAQETTVTDLQVRLDEAVRRIIDIRAGLEQQEQEVTALQSVHHDTRGQLASLETLQQTAPRLAQEIQVEAGWEHAVETALGFYLEAICVDGLDNADQLLGTLEQGAVALFDTLAASSTDSAGNPGVPLAAKVTAPWSMVTLLDGIYTADSLPQALSMRESLATRESIITRDGIWIGKSWLRVARDSDEKAGVLEREREISELTVRVEAQAASIENLRQSIAGAREGLRATEATRDQLQDDYNQAHRQASDLRAGLASSQTRLDQLRNRRDHVMMESELVRNEKASGAEELAGAQSRLGEALAATEALSIEREELTRRQQLISGVLDEARERARSDQQTAHELNSPQCWLRAIPR